MFFGVISTVNIFVVLKDMGMFSKQKMFKINHTFFLQVQKSISAHLFLGGNSNCFDFENEGDLF